MTTPTKTGLLTTGLSTTQQVLAGGERAVVQFIPRIDLVALSADPETAAARKALRPPQRFFNPEEVSLKVPGMQ